MAKGSKHARLRLRKWLNSYEDAASWIEKHGDLEQLLEEGGGLVKIDNFLPTFVAEGILEMLQGIEEKTWNLTAAGDDYAHNNIRHQFLSVKSGPPGLEEVFRIFTLLVPDSLFTFSAAKYCKAGHIVPHDDRAYTQVKMEDGSMQLCSRNIACIYYLTKGWSAADGGQLVDLEASGGSTEYIPTFNSVIAFTIPRWHEVKPVLGDRPRYSIFGWFLEPGKLYELNTADEQPQQQQHQQPDALQQLQEQLTAKNRSKKAKRGDQQQLVEQAAISKKKRKFQAADIMQEKHCKQAPLQQQLEHSQQQLAQCCHHHHRQQHKKQQLSKQIKTKQKSSTADKRLKQQKGNPMAMSSAIKRVTCGAVAPKKKRRRVEHSSDS